MREKEVKDLKDELEARVSSKESNAMAVEIKLLRTQLAQTQPIEKPQIPHPKSPITPFDASTSDCKLLLAEICQILNLTNDPPTLIDQI